MEILNGESPSVVNLTEHDLIATAVSAINSINVDISNMRSLLSEADLRDQLFFLAKIVSLNIDLLKTLASVKRLLDRKEIDGEQLLLPFQFHVIDGGETVDSDKNNKTAT